MRLLQLLCVHLLSPVLAQRGLVVNKRARQKLGGGGRREAQDNFGRANLARPQGQTGQVTQETGLTVFRDHDQFVDLPNFELQSDNDDKEERNGPYELPVWANQVYEQSGRTSQKLASRNRQVLFRAQGRDQEITKTARERGNNRESFESTDQRYSVQEAQESFGHRQVTDKPTWTVDYDPQRLPSQGDFSLTDIVDNSKFVLPEESIFRHDDRFISHPNDDFLSQPDDRFVSQPEDQFVLLTRPFLDPQEEFLSWNNPSSSQNEIEDFSFLPNSDTHVFQQDDQFDFVAVSEIDKFQQPVRFEEQEEFEPSVQFIEPPPFLPTPVPGAFRPNKRARFNPSSSGFNSDIIEDFENKETEGSENFRPHNRFFSISEPENEDEFRVHNRFIPTTEKPHPVTLGRIRQNILTTSETPATEQTYRYEENTIPSKETTPDSEPKYVLLYREETTTSPIERAITKEPNNHFEETTKQLSPRKRVRSRGRSRFRQNSLVTTASPAKATFTDKAVTKHNRKIPIRRKPRPRTEKKHQDPVTTKPRTLTRFSIAPRFGSKDSTDAPTRPPTRTRSRFRSRSRSRPNPTTEKIEEQHRFLSPRRTNSRSRLKPQLSRSIGIKESDRSSNRIRPSNPNRIGRIDPIRSDSLQTRNTAKSNKAPNVKFPKRNLFPNLPKVKFSAHKDKSRGLDNNVVDSGRLRKFSPSRSRESLSPVRHQIKPSRPVPQSIKQQDSDYGDVNIQSSREDEQEGYITVTHQATVPTVYTIVEGRETKELHAVVSTSSLQIVDVNDLTSTEIDGVGIVYAHVLTNHPQFGVKEFKFDAIEPSESEHIITKSLTVDRHKTSITQTVLSTVYNVQTVTARITETPNLSPKSTDSSTGLEVLVKNIIAGLLGKSIFPGSAPAIAQPVPHTEFKTHTRSYLTTTTSTETIVIPITLRGQQVWKTVTTSVTDTITTTDYSVQTVLNYNNPKTNIPFLPLAPTLHRAARVIPSLPMINPLNIQPVSTTQYLTQAVVSTETLTEDATTAVVVTLGGQQVKTSFVQPTTQVVTVTSYSTQTVIQPVGAPGGLGTQSNSLAKILRNINLIQNLRANRN